MHVWTNPLLFIIKTWFPVSVSSRILILDNLSHHAAAFSSAQVLVSSWVAVKKLILSVEFRNFLKSFVFENWSFRPAHLLIAWISFP